LESRADMTQPPKDSSLFGPDVEAALASAPFAPLAASGAPIIVAAGEPAQVVGATESALALFAADKLDALGDRVFGGAEPGARRLAELSRVLLPGAAPRLERLRFFFGPVAEQVTMLCQRVSGAQAPLFVMALLGVRPNLLRPPQPKAAPVLRLVESSPASEPVAASATENAPAALARIVSQAVQTPASIAPARLGFEAAREALRARFPAAAPIRFLWRTDADDRIVEIAPPLPEIAGAREGEFVGENFVKLAARLGLDPDEKLAQALASRSTWSGLERLWPLAKADAAVPVVLGASPSFDAARNFEGYRGFGVIHVARLAPHVLAPVVEAAEEPQDDAVARSFGPETEEPAVGESAAVALHESDLVETPVAAEAPAQAEPQAESEAEAATTEEIDPLEAFGPENDVEATSVADGEAAYESELAEPAAEQQTVAGNPPAAAAPAAPAPHNVVPLRLTPPVAAPLAPVAETPAAPRKSPTIQLSPSERNAFREIARALGAQLDDPAPAAKLSAATEATKIAEAPEAPAKPAGGARDLLALASRAVSDRPAEPAPTVVSAPTHDDKAPSDAQAPSSPREPLLPLAPTRLAEALPLSTAHRVHDAGASEPAPAPAAVVVPAPLPVAPPSAHVAVAQEPAPLVAALAAAELPAAIAGPQGSARALLEKLPVGVLVSRDGAPIFANRTRSPRHARHRDRRRDLARRHGRILGSTNRRKRCSAMISERTDRRAADTCCWRRKAMPPALDYLDGLKNGGVASVLNDGREVIGRERKGGAFRCS
jgi:PAS domain-containing protein